MFGFGKKDSSKTTPAASGPDPKVLSLLNKIHANKYQLHCVRQCFTAFTKDLTEDELVCLAQCSDNTHHYLRRNAEAVIAAKTVL